MCLPPPLCWRFAGMLLKLWTYYFRRRHWLLLLSWLIFSISVSLILFCPFRWDNVRLRLNRMLPLVYCCVVGMWLWGFDLELYVLIFTCEAVFAPVGCCDVCFPYLSFLMDCCFVHDTALIICSFDGRVDDVCIIILSLDYVFLFGFSSFLCALRLPCVWSCCMW